MFCIATINMQPSNHRQDRLSPRELFTQHKLDYKKDLRVAFGDYVFVPSEPSIKNSMESRAYGCIALYPTGNRTGSVKFYCLANDSVISRTQWTKAPMPKEVISYLNAMSHLSKYKVSKDPVMETGITKKGLLDENQSLVEDVKDQDFPLQLEGPLRGQMNIQIDSDLDDEINTDHLISDRSRNFVKPIQSSSVHVPEIDPNDEIDVSHLENPVEEDDNELPQLEPIPKIEVSQQDKMKKSEFPVIDVDTGLRSPSKRPTRSSTLRNWQDGPVRLRDSEVPEKSRPLGLHISIKKSLASYGKAAEIECKRELQQMIDKQVWHGVKLSSLNHRQRRRIIRSQMFIKEKFLPNGLFDKLKARIVAGGNEQDRLFYGDVSSPTVALSKVFCIFALAAKDDLKVRTVDIGGAYLNAKQPDSSEVYVKLDPIVAAMLIELDGSYKEFLNEDGTIIVRLDKALYGCIESGKLWYENLRAFLESENFVANPHDICVFNRGMGADQITVCIYVDDLIITCRNDVMIEKFTQNLRNRYKEIKVNQGNIHDYLGMRFDLSDPGKCKVTMDGFVQECLKYYRVEGNAASPALPTLFEIDESSKLLDKKEADEFHSRVAKLLYLAKRVRPDILCAVSFLSTRVRNPTEQDVAKLDRVLKYISGTKELGLVLEIGEKLTVRSFVDASFGVHSDYKGHTGGMIVLGKSALVYTKSTKQKLMGKSSTETELVATSELLPQVIHIRNFLLAQGYKVEPAVMYQDNQSTIALIKKGRSTAESTRHIAIRFYFIKDKIDCGDLRVEYLSTDDMVADIFTKPLQGERFRKLRMRLLNVKCEADLLS
jgi:histone deacetylase 1/2